VPTGKDWEKVETGVELAARALNTGLEALRDVVALLTRYDLSVLPVLISPFFTLLICAICCLLCLTVMRSPNFFTSRTTLGTAL
jgi:hypothetical protein